MRNARVRYEVFCTDPTPYQAEDPQALVTRVERSEDPDLFQAPRFGPPVDEQGKFRQPLPDDRGQVAEAIDGADVCYVVGADQADAPDLGYLDTAASLAEDIAKQRDGVIVDRTADIGYALRDFHRLRQEGLRVRDAVSLEETSEGAGVTLRTRGMAKYGQADFLLEGFPFEHLELGRRLLYDNVCDYSAFRAPVLSGQTMGSADYRLYFEDTGDGTLRITDCHPEQKAPLQGISRLLASLLPIWEAQKQKETSDQDAQRTRARATKQKTDRARAARKAGAKGRRKVKREVKAAAKAKVAKATAKAKVTKVKSAKPAPKGKAKAKVAAKGKGKAKPKKKR